MSEIPVVEKPKSKQYLLMVDEISVALLSRICPSIQFVQVEGIKMQNNETHMALVTPMVLSAPQAVPEEPKAEV